MTGLRSNDQIFSTTQFRRLTDQQCQKLYWACLEILERTGVRLYDQEPLEPGRKGTRHGSQARDAVRPAREPGDARGRPPQFLRPRFRLSQHH
jgi:hypothetical protein